MPWQMLLTLVPDPLRWSVGDPHADSSKTSLELSFRSGAPSDVPPSAIGQHVFSRHREDVRNVPLTGTAASGNRPDHLHIGRVYLEVPRDTDCPNQFASREPLAERPLQPLPASRQEQAKPSPAPNARTDLAKTHLGFVRAVRYSAGTPARSNRARLLVQLSGRNSRKASMTGTSPRASVSDTRVWQLAVLPSAEAYCAATPTECVPFLGIAVSSITRTASLPPTSLSAWTSSSVSTGAASQAPAAMKWCN